VGDTLGTGPFPLDAIMTSLAGRLDAAEATLHLDLGAGFSATPLVRLGGDAFEATFTGELPAVDVGTLVRYYLTATDAEGAVISLPEAGAIEPFMYRTLRRVHLETFETAGAWSSGLPGDDATAGVWEHGVPEEAHGSSGLLAQPGADHTPEGTACFATGLAAAGGNDVDGGVTTLESPRLDLSGLADATLRGWFWFTNHTGAWPWEDGFAVLASADDGGTWVEIHREGFGAGQWRPLAVALEAFIPLTDRVRLRFVAADTLHDSNVEALIDDLEILTATRGGTSVGEEPVPDAVDRLLLRVGPNPARATAWLRFTLPEAARVELRIYDATGRLVRDLGGELLSAGEQEIAWDGRDASGTPAGAGRYWARLAAAGSSSSRPILLLR
jgi:hypothetical protein